MMLQLRKERQQRGLSQVKLSQMTGIASADISAIENGGRKPFPGWKKRIAKALDVDGPEADKLFKEAE